MKISRHTPYGILNPLPVPEHLWQDISMDFVTGLPISDGHDVIWVVIDQLTKMRHLVPCSTTVDAKELANLFIMNIFHLHGLPNSIISDRGPQFASRFWKYLCNSLHIEPCLSTTFHPETDGQTECINLVMEQYLRAYVNYQQDNWAQYLPLAKFAANNYVSKTTGLSPFFANYGMYPKLDFERNLRVDNLEEGQAQSLTRLLTEIHDFMKAKMAYAQDRQREYADNH
jgi:transposase InsO family protein